MVLTTPVRPASLLPAHTHSCRASVALLSSAAFSSFVGRTSLGTFTLFPSCLLPRLVRCRSALAAMFSDDAPESNFVHYRRGPIIDQAATKRQPSGRLQRSHTMRKRQRGVVAIGNRGTQLLSQNLTLPSFLVSMGYYAHLTVNIVRLIAV